MAVAAEPRVGNADEQILEFVLAGERYCVAIETVAEIVTAGHMTTVPNAPPGVLGVMDLRGRTTTIVDPKRLFGISSTTDGKRIIVFDADRAADEQSVGWLVDEVTQVVAVDPTTVDDSPVSDEPMTRGLIRRDGGFVIWVDPQRRSR